ncbi:hypothetical protein DL98DRAFT_60975 [Cadophora sp. DSE1049]|nr:hypothetical protein DL98DRAFT_60975 [Cadophora sp. DSE1049]
MLVVRLDLVFDGLRLQPIRGGLHKYSRSLPRYWTGIVNLPERRCFPKHQKYFHCILPASSLCCQIDPSFPALGCLIGRMWFPIAFHSSAVLYNLLCSIPSSILWPSKAEFGIAQPSVSERWNSKTLNMNVCCFSGKGSPSPLCATLRRSCCHSLQTLVWHQSHDDGPHTFGSDPANTPKFNKLRHLRLRNVRFGDSGTVHALLAASLTVLDLKYIVDSIPLQEAVLNHGRIPSLETVVFDSRTSDLFAPIGTRKQQSFSK